MGSQSVLRTGCWGAVALLSLAACGEAPWNNPYPAGQARENILYRAYAEQPKHLDPVRSYSEDEAVFTHQIYETLVQYHFLKRPYTLIPLAATAIPAPQYLDRQGRRLTHAADETDIAFSVYRFTILPGVRYQPHPAFAQDARGAYRYHALTPDALADIRRLTDFPSTGTRELIAEDYVYEIKRMAHPKLQSPVAGIMSQYIVGLPDLAKRLTQAQTDNPAAQLDLRAYDLEGAKALDRYTLEIKINGKYAQFLHWLSMPFFAPVPWEAERFYGQPGMRERNLTLDWYPVGTGPYMLTENTPNRRMVLERNPHYHGETYPSDGDPEDQATGMLKDAGKTLPFIDQVVFSLEPENIPAWSKFLQGYYDISGVSSDSFDQAIHIGAGGQAELTPEMAQKHIELVTAVRLSSMYLGFNMLDDTVGGYTDRARLLRQAISIAIDYEEFISIFMNGRGIAAQSPLPPDLFGYRPGEAGINRYVYDWTNGRPQRKSVDAARALLAKAGYPDGRDPKTGQALALYYDTALTGPDAKARLDWLRKQFDKLGAQLVIRATDYNRFQDKMLKGAAQIYEWGWNADYPDPENFLFLLYGPNGKVEHQGENSSNYRNAEFDRLFDRMKNMDNTPERQTLIDQMIEIVRRDAPWAFGLYPVDYTLRHGWYANAKPNLMARNTLKYRRVDPVLREQQRSAWNAPVVWPGAALLAGLIALIAPVAISHRRREKAAAL